MSTTALTRVVTYRLSEEQGELLDESAAGVGNTANAQAREVLLNHLSSQLKMTAQEQLLFEEICKIRYTLGRGFSLLAAGQLSIEAMKQLNNDVDSQMNAITKAVLTKRNNSGR